jgi:hypothetical protein
MAQKNVQSLAKRARENALREKRERKREKKAAAATRRAEGEAEGGSPHEQQDNEQL